MEKHYIPPEKALKKLKTARSLSEPVYLYGATGYGKTELVRQYLARKKYRYLSGGELPWPRDALAVKKQEGRACQILVIDDLHQLKSPELRQEIISLTERQDIWLVLVSRGPIPPWLMPRYIKGGLMVISEDDLRMGEKEIRSYLESCGVPYTEADARRLKKTSEGNIYAIRHTALKMKEGKNLGPELHEEIWEAFSIYLENFVLVSLDSELLEFLMQVSVVDEFTPELAGMITGNRRIPILLEQAAEAGNFLFQKDNVYRLRPPLTLALRNRAVKVYGIERFKEFKYNAALYYEMQDEIIPALKLFEECGKNDHIKNLLIRNARRNPGNGHYYELRRYYFRLKEAEIEKSPVLMAGMSMLHSMLMDGGKSEYWYDKLKAFSAEAKGGIRREAKSRLAYLDIALPHRGSKGLIKIMQSIPALLFDQGIRLPEFSVTSNLPSTMNGGKDFCHWSPFDQKLAVTIGPLVEKILGRYGKGLVNVALGESFYEKGEDPYKVLTLLTRAQIETEQGGMMEIAFASVGLRVRLALLQGELQTAQELLASFERSIRERKALQLLPNIRALWCRLALYDGKMDQMEAWLRTAPDENQEFCVLERYRYMTKARCYLALGEYLKAQALLEKMRYYAQQTHRHYIGIEVCLLSAVTKERMGGDWQEDLHAALAGAEKYRFLRVISEEGEAVWPLLHREKKRLLENGELDRDWLRRLLTETEEMARRYPFYLKKQTAAASDFGETALTILRLQADGLSLRQISQRLGMKDFTVSYHIRENYRKLGVTRKADALLAARSLGLI